PQPGRHRHGRGPGESRAVESPRLSRWRSYCRAGRRLHSPVAWRRGNRLRGGGERVDSAADAGRCRVCWFGLLRLLVEWRAVPKPVGDSPWSFPPSSAWPDDDLVAIGADLEPSTLIAAYRVGLFPMPIDVGPQGLGWWSPDPRGILPLDHLRVTRSMRQ